MTWSEFQILIDTATAYFLAIDKKNIDLAFNKYEITAQQLIKKYLPIKPQ